MGLPVLVINRAADTARLARFRKKAVAQGVTPKRIAAIDGHAPDCPFALWQDLIGPHFWGEERIKPGALACYLSHTRAWRHLIASGAQQSLICEDDCDLLEGPERIGQVADRLGEFDILFANDRLATGGELATLADALAAMKQRAPGADCYLMTRRGAERMLDLTARQKIICGVDWAMIRHGLRPDISLPHEELAILDRHLPKPEEPLVCHVMGTPVGALHGGAQSSINHSRTVPIRDLLTRTGEMVHGDYAAHLTFGTASLSFLGRSSKDVVMEAHRDGRLWEERALTTLIRAMPEGGVFLDIGAHIGNHAVAVGRLSQARVIAVEPNPEIIRLLRMNLSINGVMARSVIHSVALGAEEGVASLSIHRRRPGESTLAPAVPEAAPMDAPPRFEQTGKARVTMRVMAGDDLLDEDRVHAIKVDTGGREIEVLKGLRETLRRDRPLVMVDHNLNDTGRVETFLGRLDLHLLGRFPHDERNREVSLFGPSRPAETDPTG